MEAEQDTELLEASRSEHTRWQCNLVLGQVLHDLLDTIRVIGEFLVVSLISLLDLFCFLSILQVKSLGQRGGAPYVFA
jgi:hypothetical protein